MLAVATLTVTPKETTPSASVVPQERINRLFRICNTGNVANAYTIANADVTDPAKLDSLYFDNDASGTLTIGDCANYRWSHNIQLRSARCLPRRAGGR